MARIKTVKQFKDAINAAFETQNTQDEAKAIKAICPFIAGSGGGGAVSGGSVFGSGVGVTV